MGKRRGHGEGGIYQRESDGKWCASVELPPLPGGKRQRKVLYGKTRREVAEKLRKLHAELDGGAVYDGSRLTVNDILDKRIANPKLGIQTRENYEKIARLHIRPMIGTIKIDKLSSEQLQHCIDTAAQTGAGTAMAVWTVLGGALRPLARAGRIQRHVVDLVEPPIYEAPAIAPLSLEQALQLLDTVKGDRFELAYRIALSLGLRIGEVFGLHKTDIDREHRTILIDRQVLSPRGGVRYGPTKSTAGRRRLAVPDVLYDAMVAHIDADTIPACERIFHKQDGRIVAPRDARPIFKAALMRAGLPPSTRFHDLRHSCATFLIAQGVHVKVIQEILGHSSIGVTLNTYGHVLPEVSRDAANKIGAMLQSPPKDDQKQPPNGD